MRLLFISGTTVGGSGRSQRELAARLVGSGHDVVFLVDPATSARLTRSVYEQFSDLSVRIDGRPGSTFVKRVERLPGRRMTETTYGGLRHLSTPIPENAAERLIAEFQPDVVVGSSILRLSWRKIRAICEKQNIPTVLYIREEEALNHFENGADPADVIVANAGSLANEIRRRGTDCIFVPSVVEVDTTRTSSTRTAVLSINPIESRGASIVWSVAASLPHIRFVVQESWPLEPGQLKAVRENLARLGNIEFRRAEAPGPQLYSDARVLLVPYRVDNRPRVIAEAQANGIPVIVADVPALVEAIGEGGVQVPLDDIDAWSEAVKLIWADGARYAALSAASVANSRRPEIDPELVAKKFEHIVLQLVR